MSDAIIRQKIFELLAGQEDLVDPAFASSTLGMIHKYERWTNDWNVFLNFFKDPETGRIFGWEIRRMSRPAEKLGGGEEQLTHFYRIKGYMALQDADQTELLFNAAIDALCDIFRGNHTLDNVCHDAGPMAVDLIEERFFGNVLCHYAELRLPVAEIL